MADTTDQEANLVVFVATRYCFDGETRDVIGLKAAAELLLELPSDSKRQQVRAIAKQWASAHRDNMTGWKSDTVDPRSLIEFWVSLMTEIKSGMGLDGGSDTLKVVGRDALSDRGAEAVPLGQAGTGSTILRLMRGTCSDATGRTFTTWTVTADDNGERPSRPGEKWTEVCMDEERPESSKVGTVEEPYLPSFVDSIFHNNEDDEGEE